MTTDGDGFPPPLAGVRGLSMEQAAALPFATRHLADLGAEVIRVESHTRAGPRGDPDGLRNKRRLALDLSAEGGPQAFLRVAAGCDIVAHNFTPRVMRRYGIDYEGVRAVNEDVIYVSLTGFGAVGRASALRARRGGGERPQRADRRPAGVARPAGHHRLRR